MDCIDDVLEGLRHHKTPRMCRLTAQPGVVTAAVRVSHGDPLAASVENGGVEQVCVDYDKEHFAVHPIVGHEVSKPLHDYFAKRFGHEPARMENGLLLWDGSRGYRGFPSTND